MEVVYDDESLTSYMQAAVGVTPDRPILIDRFLNHALECEADAISDGTTAFVPAEDKTSAQQAQRHAPEDIYIQSPGISVLLLQWQHSCPSFPKPTGITYQYMIFTLLM